MGLFSNSKPAPPLSTYLGSPTGGYQPQVFGESQHGGGYPQPGQARPMYGAAPAGYPQPSGRYPPLQQGSYPQPGQQPPQQSGNPQHQGGYPLQGQYRPQVCGEASLPPSLLPSARAQGSTRADPKTPRDKTLSGGHQLACTL